MNFIVIFTFLLMFDSAFAESTELSANQTALLNIFTNYTTFVTKVSQNFTELQNAGKGHLLSTVSYEIDELKFDLVHVKSKLDQQPFQYPMYMVNAVMAEVSFLATQIKYEFDIVSEVLTKNSSQHLTRDKLINSIQELIKNTKDSSAKHSNSREYFLIENEIQNLEKILNNLHNTNNLTSIGEQKIKQSLTRHQMSLQVLQDQANWRSPCQQQCLPKPASSLILITEPQQKQQLIEKFQHLESSLASITNSTQSELTKLNQSGYQHLTFSLDYQLSQQKALLDSFQKMKKLLESQNLTNPKYYDAANREATQFQYTFNMNNAVVQSITQMTATIHKLMEELVKNAKTLTSLCTQFQAKNPHAIEWPEIAVQLTHLQALKVTLEMKTTKEDDSAFKLKVIQQLDLQNQTLSCLMEQANWKLN